ARKPPEYFSGGGGLVSTAADYHRFAQMLAGGGELDGVRLLGPRTVRYMASNHLPGGVDLEAFGRPLFSETTFDGIGFGLGVSVTIDPVVGKVPGSCGLPRRPARRRLQPPLSFSFLITHPLLAQAGRGFLLAVVSDADRLEDDLLRTNCGFTP